MQAESNEKDGVYMPSKEFLSRRGSVWERTSFEGKAFPALRTEMENTVVSELKRYEDVTWEEGSVGGITGKWIRPAKPSGKLLYYVHGGGFTLGSSGIPMPFLLELSHRLGITCFSADYRLAPEHVFPAAPEDAFAGYQALLALGYAPERIIVCGESAGATLSLDIPLMAKAAGIPAPKAVIAMSPVTDATQVQNGKVLDGLDAADAVMDVYAPGHDKADPLISPALGDLDGYPSVFISVGGTEILLQDALIFTNAAAKAGADVRLHVGKEMIHTYPLDLWDYPEAMIAFEEIQLFIRQQLNLK